MTREDVIAHYAVKAIIAAACIAGALGLIGGHLISRIGS